MVDPGIQEFFRNKTVFLTGGSGFLGKVVTEKLLRTTEVKRIYSLIRPKRGVTIGERTSGWAKEPVFEVLLKAKPQALQRVCPIAGDCLEPDLGISERDRKLLVSEVQVVIHGAATVRFDEALHLALAINVRATRLMLQLAQQMKRLESFVHISTAYSNCVSIEIDERFYPEHLKESSDKILALKELLSNETIDGMTTTLIGSFPNTYTYTKALAEDVIRREAGDLPLCVFRPAIVMPTYKEPLTGWSDNLFGPLAIIYGGARGIVRVILTDSKVKVALVPADYCGNLTLACAWKTALGPGQGPRSKKEDLPIYTFAPSEKNQIDYGSFKDLLVVNRDSTPLSQMLWYPYIFYTSATLFPLLAFFYHTIPGYFIDTLLFLTGRKPILSKTYRKIHHNIEIVRRFTLNSFTFGTANTQRLWESMSKQDRIMFDFDMARLNWTEFLHLCVDGLRLYIAKDPRTPESIGKALRLKDRLKYLHYTFSIALGSVGGYVIWTLAKLFI